MDIKERRLQHKKLFREEILTAARELFAHEGYYGFSMRKLSAMIDHSPTTIYLYFRDKDDLLYNICEDLYLSLLNTITEIRKSEPNPREALRIVLHEYITFGLSKPDHYKVVFFTNPSIYGTPDDFMKQDTMGRRGYLCLQELVAECIKNGFLARGDPNVLTQVFWSAVHGLVTAIILTKDFPMADSNILAETMVNGLLAGHKA